MFYILTGILTYIALHCWANKLNVIAYVTDNKLTLVLTAAVVLVIHFFGKTASAAVLMAMLMPVLAAYSIPSLLAKLKDGWMRLMGLFGGNPLD